MSYGDFKTIDEVVDKFSIQVISKPFIERLAIEIEDYPFSKIERKLQDEMSFVNEVTICEDIIKPILDLVAEKYNNLFVWSHVSYNVEPNEGLKGEPDYLIAPKIKYRSMALPPLCVIEAKQDKFDEGWAQALAEMVAASKQGVKVCYASVTTGDIWMFGQLESGQFFTRDTRKISATTDLQWVFETLNWMFSKANKQV
ncbi:MAG: hypothetical protein DRR16_15595 [Candidatus Parabeggiatoa sp. nov. 3]|nr:MAG: hypothetical protein DRR00_24310 [Gammaproteobacteria bacterium]RKZ61088.1 MAG: hypothetical protein DRQ99_20995 [Gammaproteobacteria bacterium]RKZ84110.1 MAG: hypothetical protein DRR16_15595 [Gammaproteobacteria bacterium]